MLSFVLPPQDVTGYQPLQSRRYERRLGDSELAYFLPSRADGANDMYITNTLRAPMALITPGRVCTAWAIIRLRYPLLASHIEFHDYSDTRFCYSSFPSLTACVNDARSTVQFGSGSAEGIVEQYLNGPPILTNTMLSYLSVSSRPSTADPSSSILEHTLVFCLKHCLADGISVHGMFHGLLGLLGGPLSHEMLEGTLLRELCEASTGNSHESFLPVPLEDRLPQTQGRLANAANKLSFLASEDRLIGAHTFPRVAKGRRRTRVSQVTIDRQRTQLILRTCKAQRVSISSAVFALCNISWASLLETEQRRALPMMMYSAMNLRPRFRPAPSRTPAADAVLALGYFHVVLPAYCPPALFWHRARTAQTQMARATRRPHAHEMAAQRAARAIAWARVDDGVAPSPPSLPSPSTTTSPRVPSLALLGVSMMLLGVSMMGDIDSVYRTHEYPHIELGAMQCGVRQRASGALLFGWTFRGELTLSFTYDAGGLDERVVRKFWEGVVKGVDVFLAGNSVMELQGLRAHL